MPGLMKPKMQYNYYNNNYIVRLLIAYSVLLVMVNSCCNGVNILAIHKRGGMSVTSHSLSTDLRYETITYIILCYWICEKPSSMHGKH